MKNMSVCQKNNNCTSTITFCVSTNYYDKAGKCQRFLEDKSFYVCISSKFLTYKKLDFDIIMKKFVIDFTQKEKQEEEENLWTDLAKIVDGF